jgi:hypothetical protein
MSFHLPPEVWHIILHRALDSQRALSTSILDPLDKAWCSIANLISRQHIRISYHKGRDHVAGICDMLTSHASVRIDIKHIPLEIDDRLYFLSDFDRDLLALESAVHRNVEVLSVDLDNYIRLADTFALEIIKQCGPQLRYFQWGRVPRDDDLVVRVHDQEKLIVRAHLCLLPVVEHIPQFKMLEVLHISFTEDDDIHPPYGPAVLLSKLHTISMAGCGHGGSWTYFIWISQWDLPILQNVSLDLPHDASVFDGMSFVQRHGPKILLLKIGQPGLLPETIHEPASDVLNYCPNIQHLIYYADFFFPIDTESTATQSYQNQRYGDVSGSSVSRNTFDAEPKACRCRVGGRRFIVECSELPDESDFAGV